MRQVEEGVEGTDSRIGDENVWYLMSAVVLRIPLYQLTYASKRFDSCIYNLHFRSDEVRIALESSWM